MNDEPILPKAYYSIGEVCDLTDLKPHVLRYWETQFRSLQPSKNRAGNRVYRPRDVELVLLVKRLLYEEKFTIEGARRRIQEMRKGGGLEEERAEVAGPELFQVMKEELLRLRELLDPDLAPRDEGAATPPAPPEGGEQGGDAGPSPPDADPDAATSSAAATASDAGTSPGARDAPGPDGLVRSPRAKPLSPRTDDLFPQLPLGMDDI